ncbi:MAG: cytochrome-c oxidase, cbb3-type subunit III [Novosphingobium sp.]|nr:cytochrome-c oxidase, cbb3-type subunit III [Novosphingobium sp.]
MGNKHIDQATGVETVGHEWDGIEELNNPLPRWWLWALYASILWAIVYVVLYPAWPLVSKGTEGVLGWTSRGQLQGEMDAAQKARSGVLAKIAVMPVERLPEDPQLMKAAIAGGKAAFRVNCVQCHGAGAAGSKGYPNLNDDDWLWGGDLRAIEYTITHGIRQPDVDDKSHFSQMPAFGKDGLLTSAQIQDVVSYVRTLPGLEKPGAASARGAQVFAENCAVCHGPDGKGLRELGAPNLADAIWLFGGSREDVTRSVSYPPFGVMPAWGGRLDPVTIKMLSAYVHSLGGGEDFLASPGGASADFSADSAVKADAQP